MTSNQSSRPYRERRASGTEDIHPLVSLTQQQQRNQNDDQRNQTAFQHQHNQQQQHVRANSFHLTNPYRNEIIRRDASRRFNVPSAPMDQPLRQPNQPPRPLEQSSRPIDQPVRPRNQPSKPSRRDTQQHLRQPPQQQPGRQQIDEHGGLLRHLDFFHRGFESAQNTEARYLDPVSGRLRKLCVQTTYDLEGRGGKVTWIRKRVKNVSPKLLRLAYWPYTAAPEVPTNRMKPRSIQESWRATRQTWTTEDWVQVGLRWVPACIGLQFLMAIPTNIGGEVRNNGSFDPVPYRYWSYPRAARNHLENHEALAVVTSHILDPRNSERLLLPRYLCFVDEGSRKPDNPYGRMMPNDWREAHAEEPTYIFISYTGHEQFERPCSDRTRDPDGTCNRCRNARGDTKALHEIARQAALDLKVKAYWTDRGCISEDPHEISEDIYRICDVVRGARRIVVVVGKTGVSHLPEEDDSGELLRDWGLRLWTWPEIILGPKDKDIYVYTRGSRRRPQRFSKLDFAGQVWADSQIACQILDHYESTVSLSRLELVVYALYALKRRVNVGTTKFADGDLSYALMGLLRQRPKVDRAKQDSAFQAFARLSLANDSDLLLERLCCILPQPDHGSESLDHDRGHYWTNMDDFWGANLWDIEPHCHVAGLADHDTVILDGVYGASITWDQFQRVAVTTKLTWARKLARIGVRFTPLWFGLAVLFLAIPGAMSTGSPGSAGVWNFMLAPGVIILLISLALIFLSPILLLHLYGGKVWGAQPWLFGFEGQMSVREIECKIFGFYSERLTWAPYSSSLSRHHCNTEFLKDECEGTEPLLGRELFADPGMRLFTLVDTLSMTVMNFQAARPPVVALLCGTEGGMQRAVMCSYDWTTQTFYRETVLRMETRMLDHTQRIGRLRFGLKRWDELQRLEQ